MSAVIIDASVAAGWCFRDEASEAGDNILEQVKKFGAYVPSLWHLEVGNVLRQAERRNRISESVSQRQFQLLLTLPIQVDSETAAQAWAATMLLARQHKLTVYDAAYLELATRRGLPLASKDKELLAAAGREGVRTIAC